MNRQELIDSFINKLFIKFESSEVVSDVMNKLHAVDEFDSIVVNGNKIKCVYNNYNNEIIVDEVAKEIILKNRSDATLNGKKIFIETEDHYIEDPEGHHINTKKTTEEKGIIGKDDSIYVVSDTVEETSITEGSSKIVTHLKTKSIDKYKNDERVYSSSAKDYKKYRVKNENMSLLDSDTAKLDLYLLANRDLLKVINENGKERYVYCDSSELYPNNSNNKYTVHFSTDISYNDFMQILENDANGIDIDNSNLKNPISFKSR